jgi:hypothetical protein
MQRWRDGISMEIAIEMERWFDFAILFSPEGNATRIFDYPRRSETSNSHINVSADEPRQDLAQ